MTTSIPRGNGCPPESSTAPASPLKAWLRALERSAAIDRHPRTTLPVLIDQMADRLGSASALISREASLSYRGLSELSNRYARWAIAEGLTPGDTVGLMMDNCPDYMAIWLGLARAGITVALLNTNLMGEPLAHSIRIVGPRALIVGARFSERMEVAGTLFPKNIRSWTHGTGGSPSSRIDHLVEQLPGQPLHEAERIPPSLGDRALYIYTSGTTGLPKAAVVSHRRLMQWSHWFAGMMDITPADRMYDCLPMYHSVGGVVATGATLVGGGTVVLRERFSRSRFWEDVREERCTLFQYIGELCRYLVTGPPQSGETDHSLRLACGNGLRHEVWTAFQSRFRIPQILEYYASTEGNFSLYNCEGRPGSIGRVPPFLAHRYPVAIIRSDSVTGMPLRDGAGRCVRCAPGEAGEAIGRIAESGGAQGASFEGYADPEATRNKVLREVFSPGDTWYRTGDLMRRDEQGFFYFVDRMGDTFRWKGENVSTTEVAEVLGSVPGIADVAVYGVSVPGTEGRAGMAAVIAAEDFDLARLHREATKRLPEYARPLFLRIVVTLDRTGTFKLQTDKLRSEGYDPARTIDALYFHDARHGCYVPLDAALHQRLVSGLERV